MTKVFQRPRDREERKAFRAGIPLRIIEGNDVLKKEERFSILPGTPMPATPRRNPVSKKAVVVHLDDHRPPAPSMEEQIKGQTIYARQLGIPRREPVHYARATAGAPRMHKHQQFVGSCRIT